MSVSVADCARPPPGRRQRRIPVCGLRRLVVVERLLRAPPGRARPQWQLRLWRQERLRRQPRVRGRPECWRWWAALHSPFLVRSRQSRSECTWSRPSGSALLGRLGPALNCAHVHARSRAEPSAPPAAGAAGRGRVGGDEPGPVPSGVEPPLGAIPGAGDVFGLGRFRVGAFSMLVSTNLHYHDGGWLASGKRRRLHPVLHCC